jgi:hypothetical protein
VIYFPGVPVRHLDISFVKSAFSKNVIASSLLSVALCGLVFSGCGTQNAVTDIAGDPDVVSVDDVAADVAGVDVSSDEMERDVSADLVVGPDVIVPDVVGDSGDDLTDVPVVSTEVNYLVVTADSLLESATALAEYRTSKGYRTKVMTRDEILDGQSVSNFGNLLRANINILRNALGGAGTLFVVLVGDAAVDSDDGFTGFLPVEECENVIGDCYTDNRYADFDDDNVPDVALGRIPASSNAEVTAYLNKIQRHESTYVTGTWNRRVSLYIGEAGFSPEIDTLLETFTFMGLDLVPHAFDLVGAYDNKNSIYYYKPFHDKVIDLFNAGSLLQVYIGHGNSQWTQGLEMSQIDQINCQNKMPVLVLLACLNGNFASSEDTISEGLLHLENGPVGVFASTADSHPVGNAVLAYEVTRVAMGERPATVGEVFMRTKYEMFYHDDDFRQTIDQAAVVSGEEGCDDPALLYFQHEDLYNLLGDPAVEMRYPAADVVFGEITGSLASKNVTVSGTVPGVSSGKAFVSIEVSRTEYVGVIDSENTDEATIQSNWAIANNKTFASTTVDVVDGAFTANLTWEKNVGGGDRYIKVYAWDGEEFGQGTEDAFGESWINK